jgi:hypothetical protein
VGGARSIFSVVNEACACGEDRSRLIPVALR